jgi:hypothetical protein
MPPGARLPVVRRFIRVCSGKSACAFNSSRRVDAMSKRAASWKLSDFVRRTRVRGYQSTQGMLAADAKKPG